MLFVVIAVWIVGVVVNFIYGNRVLPTVILAIGGILLYLTLTSEWGYFFLGGIAFLAAIIWISNKYEMS